MSEREASHGDNYADWAALDAAMDTEAAGQPSFATKGSGEPDATSVPCRDAVTRLASVVDSQAKFIEEQETTIANLSGLLRRVERSNTELGKLMFGISLALSLNHAEEAITMIKNFTSK